MEIFQSETILEAIHKANCYFHLHFEGEQKQKTMFYKVKDTIVIEILKGRYPDIVCTAKAIQHDGLHVYAFLTLSAGDTTIEVHCPTDMIPRDAKFIDQIERDEDGTPVSTFYQKKLARYADTVVSDEEYEKFRGILRAIYSGLFAERVDALTDKKVVEVVKPTSCKMGMKPMPGTDGNVMFYTRRKLRPICTCQVSDLRKAMKSMCTFNFYHVYHYMKDNSMVNMVWEPPHLQGLKR